MGNHTLRLMPQISEELNGEGYRAANFAGAADLSRVLNERFEWVRNKAIRESGDQNIKVALGQPGEGAYWREDLDVLFFDPIDLVSAPEKKLEYQIAHEIGHRQITRTLGVIPAQVDTPLFRVLAGCMEEGRVNDFKRYNKHQFEHYCDVELKERFKSWEVELAKIFSSQNNEAPQSYARICCFEFFHQWYQHAKTGSYKINENLPASIKEVLEICLPHAEKYWATFPEKNKDEATVCLYAKDAANIMIWEIYPHIQKLLHEDLGRLLEQLRNQQQKIDAPEVEQQAGSALSSSELQDLGRELLQEFLQLSAGEGIEEQEIDQKFEIVESELSKLDKLAEDEPEKALNNPSEIAELSLPQSLKAEKEEQQDAEPEVDAEPLDESRFVFLPPQDDPRVKEIEATQNAFFEVAKECYLEINEMVRRVKKIFDRRREELRLSYSVEGEEIDIDRVVEERVLGIPAPMSEAWYNKGKSLELDYGFSILLDLSGSMKGSKIYSAFRALVVIANSFNKVGLPFEINGFNRKLHDFKNLRTKLSDKIRKELSKVLEIVKSPSAGHNNDGYALYNYALKLDKTAPSNKFLIIISDGLPRPAPPYDGDEWSIPNVLERIAKETNVKVIGLGLGKGTDHVELFYRAGKGNIDIAEFPKEFCDILEDIIKNPRKYM
jgi:hypothetical protein